MAVEPSFSESASPAEVVSRLQCFESRLDALQVEAAASGATATDFASEVTHRLTALEAHLRKLAPAHLQELDVSSPRCYAAPAACIGEATVHNLLTQAAASLMEDLRGCVRRLLTSVSEELTQAIEDGKGVAVEAAVTAAEGAAERVTQRAAGRAVEAAVAAAEEAAARVTQGADTVVEAAMAAAERVENGASDRITQRAVEAAVAAAEGATQRVLSAAQGDAEKVAQNSLEAAVSAARTADRAAQNAASERTALLEQAAQQAAAKYAAQAAEEVKAAAAKAEAAEVRISERVSQCISLVDTVCSPANRPGLEALRDMVESLESVSARVEKLEISSLVDGGTAQQPVLAAGPAGTSGRDFAAEASGRSAPSAAAAAAADLAAKCSDLDARFTALERSIPAMQNRFQESTFVLWNAVREISRELTANKNGGAGARAGAEVTATAVASGAPNSQQGKKQSRRTPNGHSATARGVLEMLEQAPPPPSQHTREALGVIEDTLVYSK